MTKEQFIAVENYRTLTELSPGEYQDGAGNFYDRDGLAQLSETVIDALLEPLAALLARPLHEAGFTVRGRKACRKLGIVTVGELCRCSAGRIAAVKGAGATTVADIQKTLAGHGLALFGD